MRVVLSAGKRGHYYLTARALQERGALSRFVTGTFFPRGGLRRRLFPKRFVQRRSDDRLASRSVTSLWPVEAAYRALRPLCGRRWRLAMHCYNAIFDFLSVPFIVGRGEVYHVANTYGVYSGGAARRAGMKVVVDQQSVHPRYALEVLEAEARRLGVWDLPTDAPTVRRIERELELADLILAPSRFVYEENVRFGIPAAKQRVVPLGVDTSLFSPAPEVRRRDGAFRILFAGRIGVLKGVHYLLEAVKGWGDPRAQVLLVGALAPDADTLLAPYAGRFTHVPTVSQERLAELYREADCFCLPSLAEGSALVTYEAMASGLPCVVTRSAGSLVEDGATGHIVPARSAEALAAAFAALADDPDGARRLGLAARAAAEACDVRHYGDRLLAAYADAFGKEGPCAPAR